METPVRFESEGQQIVGVLHTPDEESSPGPAVLFCHGFTGNKQETHRLFVQAARTLAAQGVTSLRFDFRGSGDSEGAFVDVTLSGEIRDAQRALEYLCDQAQVDPERVGLVGMSMGGLVGAHVMGQHPELKAAVLMCPVAHTIEAIKRKANPKHAGQAAFKGYIDLNGWAVGRKFVEELMANKPLEAAASTRAATLLIHGDEDASVSMEDTNAYESVLREAGVPVEKFIVKGAGHTFDAVKWVDAVVKRAADWLVARL